MIYVKFILFIILENSYFYTQYSINYFQTSPYYLNSLFLGKISYKVNKIECLKRCNQNLNCVFVVIDDDSNKLCYLFKEVFKINSYNNGTLDNPNTLYYVKNFE